jgi:hypothetical protein
VWVGRAPADRDSIEARLRAGVPPGRNAPLLFAAVALGSTAALLEVRRLFDASAPVTTRAVDALAVAGGAEDTRRLLALATRDEALAPVAVLAAGHLGSRADAQAIATAAGAVDDVVRARALESILGAEPGPPAGAPGPAGAASGRWLRGRPWTTAGALDRLDAADEPIVSRSWHALEAVVRSGVRPGVVFDAAARVGAQRRAGAELRRAVEAARRPLPAGDWHYFGRRLD